MLKTALHITRIQNGTQRDQLRRMPLKTLRECKYKNTEKKHMKKERRQKRFKEKILLWQERPAHRSWLVAILILSIPRFRHRSQTSPALPAEARRSALIKRGRSLPLN